MSRRNRARTPIEAALSVIGGRWKILILCQLFEGKRRFNELRRSVAGISQRMLTRQLRELERDGIVGRRVFAESPLRVEYSLTDFGRTLEPALDQLCEWGEAYQLRAGAPHGEDAAETPAAYAEANRASSPPRGRGASAGRRASR
jgi:DNA-binding HxlR family transcriptional regulator